MMKNNNMTPKPIGEDMPVCPAPAGEDVSFGDLQPLFDEQSRRIDAVVGSRGHQPLSLNFAGWRTQHRRMLRQWSLLAVASAAVAVYWGIDLWHHIFDIYYRVFTLLLEAVFVFIMVDSAVSAVSISRNGPVSVSLDRMPHRATPKEPSKFRIQKSKFDLSRPVNIGIAASLTLVMVACATGVGDGYTMTQDHNARIEAIDNVQSILNNI